MTTSDRNRMLDFSVAWNGITFKCTAKNLPAFKDASTWTTVTDDPDEKTGITETGKPEGLEAIELTIVSDIATIYGALQTAYLEGTEATASFTNSMTGESVSVPKCSLCGLSAGGGDNNSGRTTTVKLQPRGGLAADLPTGSGGSGSGGSGSGSGTGE